MNLISTNSFYQKMTKYNNTFPTYDYNDPNFISNTLNITTKELN
jgi:hypothetical protein